MMPNADDLRAVADHVLDHLARLPDAVWEQPAHQLEWSCRDTAAHLMDDFGFYAMQLAGRNPPQDNYVVLQDPPPWRQGSPEILFWPDPATGTAGIISCLDATAGLLCAVVAVAPPDKRGYHPAGISDASGFAAMGITEAALHAYDILIAHRNGYEADGGIIAKVLDRLFPDAARTSEPWQDLLQASGRTPETRGRAWRWDSAVR